MVSCLIKKNENLGLLISRITLGILFLGAGMGKFIPSMGPASLQAFADGMLGGSILLAVLVGVFEILGGLALLSGAMARHAGIILSVIMIGAIVLVHIPAADMMAIMIHMALIGALLNITFSGSGSFSTCKKE